MRILLVVAATTLLAACGSADDKAMAACEKAMVEKSSSKTYAIRQETVTIAADEANAGETNIAGEVVFDPGLPRETVQVFKCTTRMAPGKSEPDVISFSLVWK